MSEDRSQDRTGQDEIRQDRPGRAAPGDTLALNTKVEENFVSPLTAIRGALEILRDHPDLGEDERRAFLDAALDGCRRIGRGIDELAAAVYSAANPPPPEVPHSEYSGRVHLHEEMEIFEIDLSDLVLSSAAVVDEIFDHVDSRINATGRKWYVIVNFHNCRVWPEAWVAFAHRGKKVSVNFALGTWRFAEEGDDMPASSETLPSREAALAAIAEARAKTDG